MPAHMRMAGFIIAYARGGIKNGEGRETVGRGDSRSKCDKKAIKLYISLDCKGQLCYIN